MVETEGRMESRLFQAALNGSVEMLTQLVAEDELVLDRALATCFDETPLHISTLRGHLDFTIKLLKLKPKLTNELDSSGRSPLHLAAAEGHEQVLRELLRVNADVCLVRDQDGRIPLHLAAMKGRDEIIKYLIQAQPESIRVTLDKEVTVLHLCVKHNRLKALKVLVDVLKDDTDFINSREVNGNTILHLAAYFKQLETLKFLLSNNAIKERANAMNVHGFTAFDVLEHYPRDLKSMEIREMLLEAGVRRTKDLQSLPTLPVANLVVVEESVATRTSAHDISGRSCKPWQFLFNFWKVVSKSDFVWFRRARGTLLVTATVAATMAFQAGLSPPGGTWQDSNNHEAGTAIAASKNSVVYSYYIASNTVCLIASLTTILLIVSGFPLETKAFTWFLVLTMITTVAAMAMTYMYSLYLINPVIRSSGGIFLGTLYSWMGVCAFVIMLHTARFLAWLRKTVRRFIGNRNLATLTFIIPALGVVVGILVCFWLLYDARI